MVACACVCACVRVRVCVHVCMLIGLTEHTDRGLARVGLTSQDRAKQEDRGCVCVCVCVCVSMCVCVCVCADTLNSTSLIAMQTCVRHKVCMD